MAKRKSASTAAIAQLIDANLPHRVHTFETHSHNYGAEAAELLHKELGVAEGRVFKTLVVDLSAGKGPRRELAVCCLPVTGSLSLKKAAKAHGVAKASMADPKLAERSSGYVVGGISPIGQKHPLPTVIDASAANHETVFVSGGRRGLDLEVTADVLLQATGGSLADLVAE
ncbi:aminoacyl-tRNA deacylase [Corynebacterium hindlerae]|uniref:Cys-tRNA(Pro)/Cys-tRNA(Cys) deacylase n=1 Tax=Corynebacterium hindlerae TaxID=699041 RepID=A0A7G5FH35_9CORY|nr:aminoacyl-tRNA deacylase [Corynebacterium hindlerae]QMV85926.1 aminoacyl-tRNA deacylase [Corynebacterium hindlerae]